ncbi:FAD/NAD(P)-binding domain-containing protein [Parathielavia appendiculata]|uniref:FAD/NAD(P)-binding domain-containing protein n=1 Tax=Parathielavia appendiculata TaxID=2587402 RepID=A0AAN6Z674_9PEZI|nr:FAD/NAD(P)-binding domain-containing protein [Parathielavia appendiculata]
METLDLVVIGAGIFGLATAKMFQQLNPNKTLTILDSGSSIGGVWGKSRLYPTLKTNNMLGMFEYPDFPMTTDAFAVQPGEHISGEVMYRYLTRYAEHFGILDKIRYRTAVLTAEHHDSSEGGWTLTVQNDGTQHRIFARKLVVAAGFTSEPFLPGIQGEEMFGAPIFHSRDLVKHADTHGTAKTVTVFGGTKSAWDAVYAYASKGVKVHWIIRESGHGPVWMAPPYVTPLKKWLEKLVHTRMLAWLSPCIWGGVDGYSGVRSFYHRTAIGRAVTDAFWSLLGHDILSLNKYDSHPETKKLKPWSHPMFTASSFSILNYPTSIFDLVLDGTVRVHIADVTGLSTMTVHLSDGTQLETDLLCCATGWKHVPPVRFLPEGIEKELGLPHTPSESDLFTPEEVARADEEILSRFPRLRDQPVQNKKLKPILDTNALTTTDTINHSTPLTPWTLYRFMVPPSARCLQTRDIAFAGALLNFSTFMVAHAQALWITAYFNDQLPASVVPPIRPPHSLHSQTATVPTTERGRKAEIKTEKIKSLAELRRETLLHARFGRWRYPAGHGAQFPDFVFDGLPYLDLLVRDLGLRVRRKGGWLAEMAEPYGPEDYRNLVDEFVARVEGGRRLP